MKRKIVSIVMASAMVFGLDLFIIYKTVANALHGEKNAY